MNFIPHGNRGGQRSGKGVTPSRLIHQFNVEGRYMLRPAAIHDHAPPASHGNQRAPDTTRYQIGADHLGRSYIGAGLLGQGGGVLCVFSSVAGDRARRPVVLYGATDGYLFAAGRAGERFAVRNSGAKVVVEGCGSNGCEYMTGGRIAVLGSIGRNFAAGMSGGIAYVLDIIGDFESHCNLAQVELEPIAEEDDALEALDHQGGDLETHGRVDVSHDMTRFDAIRLHQLIEQHMHYTNSNRAREILENWSDYLPRFVKVMPVEYRRALQEMSAQQQGTSVNQ